MSETKKEISGKSASDDPRKELCQTRDLFNKVGKENPDIVKKIKKVLTGKAKVIEL